MMMTMMRRKKQTIDSKSENVTLTLNHEVLDGSMEYGVVVITLLRQFNKVLTCFGDGVAVEFQVQRAFVCDDTQITFLFYTLVPVKEALYLKNKRSKRKPLSVGQSYLGVGLPVCLPVCLSAYLTI